jgi:hypothetical protein
MNSSLSPFDQHQFMSKNNNGTEVYNATTPHVTGLAAAGFIYVPHACTMRVFRQNV